MVTGKHTELRVNLDSLIRILQCFRESGQLSVTQGTIVVSSWITGVALDTLSITLHCTNEVARFEQSIPFFSRFFTQFRIDIRLLLLLALLFLSIAEFIEDVRRAVFGQGFLKEFDGVRVVILFGVR